LPLPDSPTRPSVSRSWISKLTPSTARTGPRSVAYHTLSPGRARRRVPLDGHGGDLPGIFGHREPAMVRPAQEWVKGVVDPLADEREARDEEDDGEPREETVHQKPA